MNMQKSIVWIRGWLLLGLLIVLPIFFTSCDSSPLKPQIEEQENEEGDKEPDGKRE